MSFKLNRIKIKLKNPFFRNKPLSPRISKKMLKLSLGKKKVKLFVSGKKGLLHKKRLAISRNLLFPSAVTPEGARVSVPSTMAMDKGNARRGAQTRGQKPLIETTVKQPTAPSQAAHLHAAQASLGVKTPLQSFEEEYSVMLSYLKDLRSRESFEALARIIDKNPDDFISAMKSLIDQGAVTPDTARKWGFADIEELTGRLNDLKPIEPPPPSPVQPGETATITKLEHGRVVRVEVPLPPQRRQIFGEVDKRFLSALKTMPAGASIERTAENCDIDTASARFALNKLRRLTAEEKEQAARELQFKNTAELDLFLLKHRAEKIFAANEVSFLKALNKAPLNAFLDDVAAQCALTLNQANVALAKLRKLKGAEKALTAEELRVPDTASLEALAQRQLRKKIFTEEENKLLRALEAAPEDAFFDDISSNCGILPGIARKIIVKLANLSRKQKNQAIEELGVESTASLSKLVKKSLTKGLFSDTARKFLFAFKEAPSDTSIETIATRCGVKSATATNILGKFRKLRPKQKKQAIKELGLNNVRELNALMKKSSRKNILGEKGKKFLLAYKGAPKDATIKTVAASCGVKLGTAESILFKLRRMTPEQKMTAMRELGIKKPEILEEMINRYREMPVFSEPQIQFLRAYKDAPEGETFAVTAGKCGFSEHVATCAFANLRNLKPEDKERAKKELGFRDIRELNALTRKKEKRVKPVNKRASGKILAKKSTDAKIFTKKQMIFLTAYKNAPSGKSIAVIAKQCHVSNKASYNALEKLDNLPEEQKKQAAKELGMKDAREINALTKKRSTKTTALFGEKEKRFLLAYNDAPVGVTAKEVAQNCGVNHNMSFIVFTKLRALTNEQKEKAKNELGFKDVREINALMQKKEQGVKPSGRKTTDAIFTKKEKEFLLAYNSAPAGKSISSVVSNCGVSRTMADRALAKLRVLNRPQKTQAKKELGMKDVRKLNALIQKKGYGVTPSDKKTGNTADTKIFTEKELKFLLALKANRNKSVASVVHDCGVGRTTADSALKKLRALGRRQKTRAKKELQMKTIYEFNQLAQKRKTGNKSAGCEPAGCKPAGCKPAGRKSASKKQADSAPKNIFTKKQTNFILALNAAKPGTSIKTLAERAGITPQTAHKTLRALNALNEKQKTRAAKELGLKDARALNAITRKRQEKSVFSKKEIQFLTAFIIAPAGTAISIVAKDCGILRSKASKIFAKLSNLTLKQKIQAKKELGLKNLRELNSIVLKQEKRVKAARKASGKRVGGARHANARQAHSKISMFTKGGLKFLLAYKNAGDKSIKQIAGRCGVSQGIAYLALTKLRAATDEQKEQIIAELQLKDRAELETLVKRRKPGQKKIGH